MDINEVSEQEIYNYLDALKETEIPACYAEKVQQEFNIPSSQADGIVKHWKKMIEKEGRK